jgi:hypothetical protein
MSLSLYFENNKGVGILSTADRNGVVNSAVYARPHIMDDGSVGLIMANRLSHENLKTNPHAAYLFVEEGPGYRGKRLKLTKVKEEQDTELVQTLRRRFYAPDAEDRMKPLSLVYFKVDEELPLVGVL